MQEKRPVFSPFPTARMCSCISYPRNTLRVLISLPFFTRFCFMKLGDFLLRVFSEKGSEMDCLNETGEE